MWRKLFKYFGARVCITEYHDEQIRWRFMFKDPRGGYRARAIIGWVRLLEDNIVNTPSHIYVKKWFEV